MNKFEAAKQAQEELEAQKLKKRFEQLQAKAIKKTPIESEKPYYLAVNGFSFLIQALTFAASLGIVLFAFAAFDSLLASLVLCILFALNEPAKHYLNKYYNEQRLYQDRVPQIAFVLILFVGLWSVATSFVGTPYAVETIVKKPDLINMASFKR